MGINTMAQEVVRGGLW